MRQTSQYLARRTQKGVYAPLFDCLSFDEADIILDLQGIKESIVRELEIILNTRPTAKSWDFLKNNPQNFYPLPHHFGLRDFSFDQASSERGRREMAQEISRVIEIYEPRLKNPRVRILLVEPQASSALIEISGDVTFQNVIERMTFPVPVTHLFRSSSSSQGFY